MPTASPTARKRVAPKSSPATEAPDVEDVELLPAPVQITIAFDRDGESEDQVFTARPKFTYKRMREAARARTTGGIDAVMRFEKMIVPSLCDDDGVPVKWVPAAADGQFTDPDGVQRDVKELAWYLDPANGSSRRRWAHLMDDDDDAEPDLNSLVQAYEDLVGAATERPTQRSKS